MSAEIPETNDSQIPSSSFLNAPPLSQSKSRKTPSQVSKALDNTITESPIEFATASKPSDASICEEANDSFVPKDESVAGLTLDVILGSTFRQIDLTTLQDFSSELFPNRPVLCNQKAVVQNRKGERPDSGQKNIREEKGRSLEKNPQENSGEASLKTSTSFSPDAYPQMERSRFIRKQSQKSLIMEKGDRVSQDTINNKPKEKSPESSLLRSRIKVKSLAKENNSFSPSPAKTKNKFIESKRIVAENHGEIGSISPTRSTECSIERKKARAPRNMVRRVDEEIKNLSFGVEGKSIDWHNRPSINKNGSQIFLDKSQEKRSSIPKVGPIDDATGKGYLKVLQMLNATGGLQIPLKGGMAHNPKIYVEDEMRGEQWDLFKKYGAKFGIKAQEYFGITGGTHSMIDPKFSGPQPKTKKVPTPFLKKRNYGEIDLSKVKAQAHGYI